MNTTQTKLRIIKSIGLIQNLLKTDLSYFEIKKQVEMKTITENKINFSNSEYGKNGKYRFPYNFQDAKAIIENAQVHADSFTLLKNTYFISDLNLHSSIYSLQEEVEETDLKSIFGNIDEEFLENSKFSKSNLDQKSYFQTLEIATWSYSNLIVSAVFFYLENLYNNYLEKKKRFSANSFSELKLFASKMAFLFLNKIYGKSLFGVLQQTNIFFLYPEFWFYGFVSVFRRIEISNSRLFENQDRGYFYKNLKNCGLGNLNFFHVALYLKSLNNFIPEVVIHEVCKYCYRTRTIHVLYYVLKKYQNYFDQNLTENQKKQNDEYLTMRLKNELMQDLNKNFDASLDSQNETSSEFLFNIFNNSLFLPFFIFLISNQFAPEIVLSAGLTSDVNSVNKIVVEPTQKAKNLQQSPQSQPKIRRKQNHDLSENFNTTWRPAVEKIIPATQFYTTTYSRKEREIQAALLNVNGEENWIQTGLTGKYALLKKERIAMRDALRKKYGKDVCPIELVPTDQDHLNAECIRGLLEISRPEGICISTWNIFNRNRELANKGKKTYVRADELRNCDLRQMTGGMYFESIKGACERTQNSTQRAEISLFESFEKNGIYSLITHSYWKALPLAINECCKFALLCDLKYKEKGIMGSFTLPQILRCIQRIADEIPNLSDYRIVGNKFKLEYLIEKTILVVEDLRDMAVSLQLELDLGITNKYNKFVEDKLHNVCDSVYRELIISIQQYQLYMDTFKLEKVSQLTFDNLLKLINTKRLILKSTLSKPGILYGAHELHDNDDFLWIDSGNLDSTKRHPALLLSSQSRHVFLQQVSQLDLDFTLENYNEDFKSIEEKLKQKYGSNLIVTEYDSENELDNLQVASTLGGLANGTIVSNELIESSSEPHQKSQMESQSKQTEFPNLISQKLSSNAQSQQQDESALRNTKSDAQSQKNAESELSDAQSQQDDEGYATYTDNLAAASSDAQSKAAASSDAQSQQDDEGYANYIDNLAAASSDAQSQQEIENLPNAPDNQIPGSEDQQDAQPKPPMFAE